jgi:hypothetical protein
MAGLGYKLFAAGEVLTAANLQGYAVDQSTMVFATSAARTTALPAPSQGMVSWLNDSGTTWQYYELYNASTNPGGAAAAGWYPLSGQASFLGTFSGSATTGANVLPGQAGFLFTELYDGLGWHSTSVNTERIIPTVPGMYRVTAAAQYAGNATGSRVINLYKNTVITSSFQRIVTTAHIIQVSTIMVMNGTTDYVYGLCFQDSGSTLAITGQMAVEFIRPSQV